RRTTPVDMGMQVDEARRDDQARRVAHFGPGVRHKTGADRRHLAAAEADVRDRIEMLRRIDDAPALEDEIHGHCSSLSSGFAQPSLSRYYNLAYILSAGHVVDAVHRAPMARRAHFDWHQPHFGTEFARWRQRNRTGGTIMDRRAFLKSAAAASALSAAGSFATPAISQRAAARALRFVPQADLANFDPIWGTQYVVRNASAMVWDTLYGVDEKLEPQRQMAEGEEVSADGLTWTFRLRPGLKFHDGEKVLAKDVVASLDRWSGRDQAGLLIKAIQQELTAVDDRTVKWVLKKPFPKMLLVLGKLSTQVCFIMPERIAKSDPFKQITEYIGSGPMRFMRNEWVPGARAAFEKFADYVPRQEPSSWLAGGKQMRAERIEWIVMPDPATAAAALQSGEVDWWESPISDLVPLLRKNRNLAVDIKDPLGNIG